LDNYLLLRINIIQVSERYEEQEDTDGGEPDMVSGTFAGVITLDDGERALGIFNDYSNTHMSSDPVTPWNNSLIGVLPSATAILP